jgi:hypothetical protein
MQQNQVFALGSSSWIPKHCKWNHSMHLSQPMTSFEHANHYATDAMLLIDVGPGE